MTARKMWSGRIIGTCFILLIQIWLGESYKHVILMHGLFGSPSEFSKLDKYIEQVHPNTSITMIDSYDELFSLEAMWKQTNKIRAQMSAIMKQHPEGVHLLCYSQGGLICRAVLETLPDHNVENFISLSSPQGGQYGDTGYLKYLFPHIIKEELYKFFYRTTGQKLSIANYWNDPHHQDKYKKFSNFLAVLNNQSSVNHTQSQAYKKNFLRLKHLVLIGGPNDEVITPWQSSQFGAFDSKEKVVEMRQQEWYKKDWFGLKTLDQRKAITTYSVPGHKHLEWPRNMTIFKQCMEQWLT